MNDKRKGYLITWFIENYSYCWHNNGEHIFSPRFSADGLEGTLWSLRLFPRGNVAEQKGHVSFFLARSKLDDGPEDFPLKYNLSALTADGSILTCKECEHTFKHNKDYGWPRFLKMDDVLLSRKAEFLPRDILCVTCKIHQGEEKIQRIERITARTRIAIKHISFRIAIESFDALEPNLKKMAEIKLYSKMGLVLTCSLYFTDDSWCDGKIFVEILPIDSKNILSRCRLSLIDKCGKLIQCSEADNRFNSTRQDIDKLPLSLTRQMILNRKDDYLPDGKLTLLCECTFSAGIEYENIESTLHDMPIAVVNQINHNDHEVNSYNATAKLSACPNALDDFKTLYNDQMLNDVELKTTNKSFPAHKNVLCARSPVFKAMLTNDMKEKITDRIQIDDLEDDTVQQFLLFLYSDQLEKLEWESAIKLYYAGDKYAIEKLKVVCASFLMKHLSTSNAGDLLLLADTHNDSDLKRAVEDFIFKNEEEIFGSEQWRNLMKINSMLVSETMCRKYMRNM